MTTQSTIPSFDGVYPFIAKDVFDLGDKRIGQLTQEQELQAHENWIRCQFGFFVGYYRPHISLLLHVIDELRKIQSPNDARVVELQSELTEFRHAAGVAAQTIEALQERGRGRVPSLRDLQRNQPWTVPYSRGLLDAQPMVPHIMGSHVTLHAAKSVGKIAAVFEALDHADAPPTDVQIATLSSMAADLVTAAMRIANLYGFDLLNRLRERVAEKNGGAQ